MANAKIKKMKSNYTTDELIRFIYKEMSADELTQTAEALKTDSRLQEEYEALIATINNLNNEVLPGPSETSIEIIMNFAKAQHPELQ